MVELREKLANLEHEQWIHWSEAIANKLLKQNSLSLIEEWKINWKPYEDLSYKIQEHDRIWADKVLKIVLEEVSKLKRRTNEYGDIIDFDILIDKFESATKH